MTRRAAFGLLALAAILLIVQIPRANRLLVGQPDRASDGTARLITAAERRNAVQRVRKEAAAQARFLADLDRAERQARSLGVGRDTIRSAFGRIVGPGMPREAGDLDATDLLDLPRAGTLADPARVRSALEPLLGRHGERREPAR